MGDLMCRMVTVINNNVLYVGWHHWLDGHEFGDGQRSLVCCSQCGGKDLDMTKWLNWTDYMLECYQKSRSYILSPHMAYVSFVMIWYKYILENEYHNKFT